MLDEATPDLLIVALPPFAHGGQVEAAARAGVNLLVEKPIALDMDRAERMVAAVRDGGVVGACGFMYRFGEAVEALGRRAPGETGEAGHFSGQFHCNALHAPWWRELREVRRPDRRAADPHHRPGAPRARRCRRASMPARRTSFTATCPGYSAEDVSAIVLGYDDGRIGVLHASNAAVPGRWAKRWQIVAGEMTGVFEDWNNAELFRTDGEVTSQPHRRRRATSSSPSSRTSPRPFASGASPLVPLRDGAASLRIALAARRSATERREVAL